MNNLYLLFIMIFLHIVDDYYLQGWLASAKQKAWWKQNSPDMLYKHDYIVALFMHSFSWSFMIMLPALISNKFDVLYVIVFMLNILIHMFVDNLKANIKKINLIQDQLIHLFQVFITWIIVF